MIDLEFGQQFFLTALSIAGGIVGGGYMTLQISRKMRNAALKDSMKNMIESIKQELEDAKEGVEKFKQDPAKWNSELLLFKGEKPLILKPAYDSAVSSGNFVLLEKSLQKGIPSAYLTIDAINFYSNQIRRFTYQQPGIWGIERTATALCDELDKNVRKLDDKLGKLLPKLKTS